MPNKVDAIEGIGPKYQAMLNDADIATTEELLEHGASRAKRHELAEKTGINEKLLLKWVNMADLFRIKGVASQYAELLEAAGVDTVKELRHRNADNLADKMHQINETKHLCRKAPDHKLVGEWIEQAKSLEPMVTH